MLTAEEDRCPVFARTRPKIPFFCRAADMPWGLISPEGDKWGDCQNDYHSQRALGVDTRDRTLDRFRHAIASGGRCDRKLQAGQYGCRYA
jgi:hypothetical protein